MGWIFTEERLPEVKLDKCGNLITEEVLLWVEKNNCSGNYDFGFLNPICNTFERLEEDGPATVCSVKDVIAWSTLPNRLMRKEGSL